MHGTYRERKLRTVNNRQANWWLYVLKLEGDKYYVGITTQTPEIRMNEHAHHVRSANWTRKYRPLKLHYKKELGRITKKKAELYEARVTRKYMKKYGLNNVRGGDLTDADDYTARLGRIFTVDDWQAISLVIFLVLIILLMSIELYLK